MLAWTPEYSTGSPLIDEQHRMLFEKLNKLEHMLQAPQVSKQEIDLMLSFLESYTKSHFRFEEQCMCQYHCPAHEANREAHNSFLHNLQQQKLIYAAQGPRREFLEGLHAMIEDWIRSHIMRIDTQLRPCVQKHQG